MYYCCTRSEGPIYQGRGKNRKAIHYFGMNDAIRFAKEYSIKYQKICEVWKNDYKEWDEEKAKKVAAYKKGETIYFNIR